MAVLKYKDENGNYQPIVGINMQNEVVQTTGNSTTAVMSQKAVSDLVPAQASSSNQLADKEFVNSSITTATATYQGSYNLVSDLSLTISASHGQIETALNTAASGADKNDYCFVQIPTADATPTEIASVERYKHNGTTWSYEYAINNSGFTAAQWAAVNSSITSGLVGKLSGMVNTPYTSTLGLTKLFGMNDNGDCSNIGLSDLASVLGVERQMTINRYEVPILASYLHIGQIRTFKLTHFGTYDGFWPTTGVDDDNCGIVFQRNSGNFGIILFGTAGDIFINNYVSGSWQYTGNNWKKI